MRIFPQNVLDACHRSIIELRYHGREPVRIRMHPDDLGLRLLGLPVVFDEDAPPGAPVAEWDPFGSSERST